MVAQLSTKCVNYAEQCSYSHWHQILWPEIKPQLYKNGQTLIDRPDVLVHLYIDKTQELYRQINELYAFEKQFGYVESMEFQKSGGPHLHRIIVTEMVTIPAIIDDYIWAFILKLSNPDDKADQPNALRRLRELVI